MTAFARAAGASLATVVVAIVVAAFSRLPMTFERTDHAVVRLTWRVRGERIEVCRTLSAEEQAALPVHMRRDRVCEGRGVPYRLTAVVGDSLHVDVVVHPSGARADRPVYVYNELALQPGAHRLRVRFGEALQTSDPARVPAPTLSLDRRIVLKAGDVALITYDAARQELVLRGYGQDGQGPSGS